MQIYYQEYAGLVSASSTQEMLFPRGILLSLAESLDMYRLHTDLMTDIMGGSLADKSDNAADPYFIVEFPVGGWSRSSWPLFSCGDEASYVAICDQAEQQTAPIYYVFPEANEFHLAYDSLTTLLLTVVNAHETGAYLRQPDWWVLEEDPAKLAPIINHYNPRRVSYLFQRAGNAQTVADLVKHLAHADRDVASSAMQALILLGDTSSVPLIMQQLHQPAAQVRNRVAETLGRLGDLRAAAALVELGANDPDASVRKAAQSALRELALGHAPIG